MCFRLMAVHESLKASSVAEAQLDVYRGCDDCTDTGTISIKASVSVSKPLRGEQKKGAEKEA